MAYALAKLPREPIIVLALGEDYAVSSDGVRVADEAQALLDAQREEVYLIIDLSAAQLTLNDVVGGVGQMTRQRQLFQHGNLYAVLAVTDSRLLKSVTHGVSTAVLGAVRLRAFESLDAALIYARNEVAGRMG